MTTNALGDGVDDEFMPKEQKDIWRIAFNRNRFPGHDFVLLIENSTTRVSYQIEVGLTEDGRLYGQITPDEGDNGPDALVLFDITPSLARVSDNLGGVAMIIQSVTTDVSTPDKDPEPKNTPGFY